MENQKKPKQKKTLKNASKINLESFVTFQNRIILYFNLI